MKSARPYLLSTGRFLINSLYSLRANTYLFMGLSVFIGSLQVVFGATYGKPELQNIVTSPYVSWGVDVHRIPGYIAVPQLKNSTPSKNTIFNSLNTDPTINLPNAYSIFEKKKDVTVAVIDTGININHEFLKNNVIEFDGKPATSKNYGLDFSLDSKKGILGSFKRSMSILKEKLFLSSERNKVATEVAKDQHGHGTHVSGIIKSIFPDVKILPLKYFSNSPLATGSDHLVATKLALRAAIDAHVDIINYSGGGPESDDEEKALMEEANQKGILVVAAAGNESSNVDADKKNAYFPACYNLANIISVAAYSYAPQSGSGRVVAENSNVNNPNNSSFLSSSFSDPHAASSSDSHNKIELIPSSNWGKQSVDIAAPGYRIQSASLDGTEIMTGTSQATAFVTGVAALIKSNYPEATPEMIKNIIISSAPEVKEFKDKLVSGGKLDATAALIQAGKVMKKLLAQNKFKIKKIDLGSRKFSSN